jgi:hypothetical protein
MADKQPAGSSIISVVSLFWSLVGLWLTWASREPFLDARWYFLV